MLANRLVRLIQAHSAELSAGLQERIRASSRTFGYRLVSDEELQSLTREIYNHLADWLLSRTESDLELRYVQRGMRGFGQGVKFSEFVWALVITKENLWRFIQSEGGLETMLELFSEIELFQMLDQYFDRALYYACVGYERAARGQAAA